MALPHFRPRPIGQGRSGLVGRLQEAVPLLSSPSIAQVVIKKLSVEVVDIKNGEVLVLRFNSIQVDDDVCVVMSPSPWSCVVPSCRRSQCLVTLIGPWVCLEGHMARSWESLNTAMMVCLATMWPIL